MKSQEGKILPTRSISTVESRSLPTCCLFFVVAVVPNFSPAVPGASACGPRGVARGVARLQNRRLVTGLCSVGGGHSFGSTKFGRKTVNVVLIGAFQNFRHGGSQQGTGAGSAGVDRGRARREASGSAVRGRAPRRNHSVPADQQDLARRRQQDPNQRRQLQAHGEHSKIPGGGQEVRRPRRGDLPDGRPVRAAQYPAGDAVPVRPQPNHAEARRVLRAAPRTQDGRREQARVQRGADASHPRRTDRTAGRIQQGSHPGRNRIVRQHAAHVKLPASDAPPPPSPRPPKRLPHISTLRARKKNTSRVFTAISLI